MDLLIIFTFFAFFIIGENLLYIGSIKISGKGALYLLNKLSNHPSISFFPGIALRLIILSDLMVERVVVSFVDSMHLNSIQGTRILITSSIGSILTGCFMLLPIGKLSLVLIALGAASLFFTGSKNRENYSKILLGLGILFYTFHVMLNKNEIAMIFNSLHGSNNWINLFALRFSPVIPDSFSTVILTFIGGFILSIIIKEYWVIMGITILLLSLSLNGPAAGFALLSGHFAGKASFLHRSTLKMNAHTQKVSFDFALINIVGGLLILPFLPNYLHFIELILNNAISPGKTINVITSGTSWTFVYPPGILTTIFAFSIFFILWNCIAFYLFPYLSSFFSQKIKTKSIDSVPNQYPFNNLQDYEFSKSDYWTLPIPEIAFIKIEKKMTLMAQETVKSALIVQDIITSGNSQKKLCNDVLKNEKIINAFQFNISSILIKLSSRNSSEQYTEQIARYMAIVYYIERYAGYIASIATMYDEFEQGNPIISENGQKSLVVIFNEASNFFNISFGALQEHLTSDRSIEESREIDRRVKILIQEARIQNHLRLREKICNTEEALFFVDLMHHIDGMRSQAYNIAMITFSPL